MGEGIEIRRTPSICHDQPYLAEGAGVRVIDIVDRVRAGDSAHEVARDFGVRPESVRLLMEVAEVLAPAKAKRVWVIEYGEYEDREIFGIANSLAAAVVAIKRTYSHPYLVRWEEPQDKSWTTHGGKRIEEWILVGHFEAVRGKSSKHTAAYSIIPHDVEPEEGKG